MSDLVKIEHGGKRVLTTQQLAEAYGVDVNDIHNNYHRNMDRYKEGVHYFKVVGDDLKSLVACNSQIVSSKTRSLMLWTERGALFHAKSLGTDEAWDVYGQLVETYFRAQEMMGMLELIKNDPIIAIRYEQLVMKKELEETNRRQQLMENKQQDIVTHLEEIKGSFARKIDNWRKDTNDIINSIVRANQLDHREFRNECYAIFKDRAHCNLDLRLKRLRGRMAAAGATKTVVDSMNYLDVISEDEKYIQLYVGVVREVAARYS